MKKIFYILIFSLLLSFCITFAASADDFNMDSEGKYNVEITGKTPGKDYVIVVLAGDYTNKDMPEVSVDNIIYIDQTTADDNGVVSFSAFIPMTESVGTVYIGGDDTPSDEGTLMTESGLGYIAGRLISYSGKDTTVVLPEEITHVEQGAFENSAVQNVVIKNSNTNFSNNAFVKGTKLFFSPIAKAAKEYAIENGYSYSVLGDYNGDNNVNSDDYTGFIGHYAKGQTINDATLSISLDLDFSGNVNFRDLSVLLKYLGGRIADYIQAFTDAEVK